MKKHLQAESLAEAQHYAERTLPTPKGLYASSLALAPILLKSALFRPAAGDRAKYADWVEIAAEGGHRVFFIGEELRQDDQRVLLLLLREQFYQLLTREIEFQPRAFARDELGWADGGVSVKKLNACLERLAKAKIKIAYKNGSVSIFSLVAESHFDAATKMIRVLLSPTIVSIFESGATFLAEDQRLKIGDNLVSWVFGYVKAQNANKGFLEVPTAHLRALAAQESYEQKAFNVRLKAALGELQEMGVVGEFDIKGATLTVQILRKL